MRYGGEPVSEAEALGVARRLARTFAAAVPAGSGRRIKAMADVESWPPASRMTQVAWRMPQGLIFRVRARAEMEGRTVTDVVREALEAYASSSPGSRATYATPRVGRRRDPGEG